LLGEASGLRSGPGSGMTYDSGMHTIDHIFNILLVIHGQAGLAVGGWIEALGLVGKIKRRVDDWGSLNRLVVCAVDGMTRRRKI